MRRPSIVVLLVLAAFVATPLAGAHGGFSHQELPPLWVVRGTSVDRSAPQEFDVSFFGGQVPAGTYFLASIAVEGPAAVQMSLVHVVPVSGGVRNESVAVWSVPGDGATYQHGLRVPATGNYTIKMETTSADPVPFAFFFDLDHEIRSGIKRLPPEMPGGAVVFKVEGQGGTYRATVPEAAAHHLEVSVARPRGGDAAWPGMTVLAHSDAGERRSGDGIETHRVTWDTEPGLTDYVIIRAVRTDFPIERQHPEFNDPWWLSIQVEGPVNEAPAPALIWLTLAVLVAAGWLRRSAPGWRP